MARHQHRNSPKIEHAPDNAWNAFPSYRGGDTTTMGGYVWEFVGPHHLANRWGFVAQHRLVGEDILGRRLRKGEVVHHHNNVRSDNRKENLQVMTVQEHRRHHWAELADILRVPIDVDALRAALKSEGSVKGAARVLGVDHNVIRNRFPGMCKPYQRQSPTKIDDPRDLDRIAAFAADPDVGYREAAAALKMSAITIQRICKRRGWVWQKKSRGPWAADDARRERQRAIRAGLKVGERLPAPAARCQP